MRRFGLLLVALFILGLMNVCQAADLKEFTKKYEQAVVYITTYDEKGRQMASGSGFFVNPEGDFVTNKHVIQGAVSATIETVDGSKYTLNRLIALKPDVDLVLASINSPNGPTSYLEIAQSLPAKGERVVVFGNPQRVKFSVSEGIVSGIQTFPNVEWPQLSDFRGQYVQFTAAVSPGSSGGPVLNEKGQVVGVTTWMLSPKVSQNVNFAIPASAVSEIIESGKNPPAGNITPVEPAKFSEKKRVAMVVMYGPKLMELIPKQAKLDEITAAVEEAIASEFRPNKYIVKGTKDVFSRFDASWKVYSGSLKSATLDDIDKPTLAFFGQNQQYDVVVFAGIEIAQAKQMSNLAYAASAVEVEVDLRVMNVARQEYSYAQLLVGQGSDAFQKFWGWESPNMVRPVLDAATYALRIFRRDFSADQIL